MAVPESWLAGPGLESAEVADLARQLAADQRYRQGHFGAAREPGRGRIQGQVGKREQIAGKAIARGQGDVLFAAGRGEIERTGGRRDGASQIAD